MTALERLSDAYLVRFPEPAARALERFPAGEVAGVLGEQEPAAAAATLGAMAPPLAAEALAAMEVQAAAAAAAALPPGVAAALLRRMATERSEAIIKAAPAKTRSAWQTLLRHPRGSAGALMDPTALWLPRDRSAGEALVAIRREPARVPPYLYLTDGDGRLAGVVDLLALITADEAGPLSASMQHNPEFLRVDDPAGAVLAHAGWHRLRALPVLDGDDRLVGVVGREAAMALRQEMGAPRPPLPLVLSLAELFWIEVAGMTEGCARLAGGTDQPEEGGG